MICKPCRQAAAAVTRLGNPIDYIGTATGAVALDRAMAGHEQCIDPGQPPTPGCYGRTRCDCQHRPPIIQAGR